MSRWTKGMQLQIIYLIRKNKEISLMDLHNSIFDKKEFTGTTDEGLFCASLLDLYGAKFINIYTKTVNSINHLSNQNGDSDEDHIRKLLKTAIRNTSLSAGYSLMNVENPRNIFISITEYFYRVQETIGFSVSDELSQRQEQWHRNSIWGEVNPRLTSQVFVIMPFLEQLSPVYEDHIKAVCNKIGYSCLRADLITNASVIMNDIWSLIYNSDIIICDCTGKNPNVFYELGIAHAIGKNVICITQNPEDIPFDIRQIRYIKYEYTPRGMKEFEQKLEQYMAITIADKLSIFI